MLTVVVLSRNRRTELLQTLARLRALPERPAITVIDNGSEDGTGSALAGEPGLSVIELGENRGGAARNLGVELAHTPYVAFCDDDSWWEPGALERGVRLLESHPRLGLLAARVHVGAEQRLDPTCAAMRDGPVASQPAHPGIPVLGFLACGAIVRREALLSAGGFHERLGIGGEEQLLAVDLCANGWQVAYMDELIAHHHPSPVRNHQSRKVAMARNALWFCWLRRPLRIVLAHTASALLGALREKHRRVALLAAIRGLPWALSERRCLPAAIEAHLRLLERAGSEPGGGSASLMGPAAAQP